MDGDGFVDLVAAAGPGGGPRVSVFNGRELAQNGRFTRIRDFFAYSPAFRGGVYVDAADFNNDKFADILTGPGRGGSADIRIFNGATLPANGSTPPMPLTNFIVDPTSRAGVGGVAFVRAAGFNVVDVVVGSARESKTFVLQYANNNGTLDTANPVSLIGGGGFDPLPPNGPQASQVVYGTTVAGFIEGE